MNSVERRVGRRRLVVVHRIPSPYRIHLFNCIHRELQRHDIDFEVHFMDICSGDRAHWNTSFQADFSYRFWPNFKLPTKKGVFNPSLLRHLRANPPDVIVFGGVWDSVTSMVGILFKGKSLVAGWYEANDLIPGKNGGLYGCLKKQLLNKLDFHVIPGARALRFLQNLYGKEHLDFKVSYLPNLVDESKFHAQTLSEDQRNLFRSKIGIPFGKRVIFTPARLIPKKGIRPFLEAYAKSDFRNWHYLILGDGPERAMIEAMVEDLGLVDHVTIKAFIPYDEMPMVYQIADIFCLPSVNDPNPLSVVEAMHMGLPLLVSNRLGNFPEAMEEGVNGHSFEPGILDSTLEAIKSMQFSSAAELNLMGNASKRIAKARWDSPVAVQSFLKPIIEALD